MDLELLNYLITPFDFFVSGNELKVRLPACDEDKLNKVILPLSKDTNKILAFFGYDTTVELGHLTERALFNYLTTSQKLVHVENIKPAKNAQHQRFSKFLKSQLPHDQVPIDAKHLKQSAFSFFEKTRDYQVYQYQYQLLNNALKVRDKLQADPDQFSRFMKLHGMNTVIKSDKAELTYRWEKFKSANWTCMDFFLN